MAASVPAAVDIQAVVDEVGRFSFHLFLPIGPKFWGLFFGLAFLLEAERFDRIQRRGLLRRIVAEEDTDHH